MTKEPTGVFCLIIFADETYSIIWLLPKQFLPQRLEITFVEYSSIYYFV